MLKDTKGYWYQDSDGSYPQNAWKQINSIWYYFNDSCYIQTGWKKIANEDYYFKSSGAMAANEWIDNSYYVDSTGKGIRGRQIATSGWKNSRGYWYQLADGTYPKSSWRKMNNIWYYFDGSGYRQTGWQKINGSDYYFNLVGLWPAMNG